MIKKLLKIADIDVLCRANCKIKDPDRLEGLLNEFIGGGVSKLQVVSDFDFTITKQRMPNGDSAKTSFGMFLTCKSVPDSCLRISNQLATKYRPLEHDLSIPHAQRFKAMEEWYTQSSEIYK